MKIAKGLIFITQHFCLKRMDSPTEVVAGMFAQAPLHLPQGQKATIIEKNLKEQTIRKQSKENGIKLKLHGQFRLKECNYTN